MVVKRISEWRKLPVTITELCIDTTLRCGQSFRWRKFDDEWYSLVTTVVKDQDSLTNSGSVRFMVAFCHSNKTRHICITR